MILPMCNILSFQPSKQVLNFSMVENTWGYCINIGFWANLFL